MSVIRRKHTTNFTTISNALRDDERLQADEVGILYFLLTQPHDWEIRRPALRRRWHLGEKGLKRIIDNWLRTGWLHAEKTRLGNGQFVIVYEVRDEPGPPLSDEEVRAALSVVSTEVGDDESSDDDGLESTGPPPPQPPLADHPVATGDWQESLNIDSQNTIPPKAAAIWRDLRDAWPSVDILSPIACEKLFAQLSQTDRQRAFDGAKPYLARCKDRNRKVCDLSTYLKERRFETVKTNGANGSAYTCRLPMPEAARWLEYLRASGGSAYLVGRLERGETISTREQWPPALPAKQQSTGPPLPLSFMTSEDEKQFG